MPYCRIIARFLAILSKRNKVAFLRPVIRKLDGISTHAFCEISKHPVKEVGANAHALVLWLVLQIHVSSHLDIPLSLEAPRSFRRVRDGTTTCNTKVWTAIAKVSAP